LPFIETDLLFALLNDKDKHHDIATRIFGEIESGLQVHLPSSVLLEMELIYKSEGREADLMEHMVNLLAIKGLNPTPLTPEIILLAISLRQDYNLTFFDSHHVSASLQGDGILVSTDQAFRSVKGLDLLDPYDFISKRSKSTENG